MLIHSHLTPSPCFVSMLAAVLHGLPSLRHLGLHGYRELQLEHLLPCVAATLQVRVAAGREGGCRCVPLLLAA